MRAVREAYADFWSQFLDRTTSPQRHLPAFSSGQVVIRDAQGRPISQEAWPPGSFPYLTYELIMTQFGQPTIVSVNIWDRPPAQAQNPFGRVDDVLEQVRDAIPEGGILIDVGDEGTLYMRRSTPFISYLDDPDDPQITRAIVRVVISSYIA